MVNFFRIALAGLLFLAGSSGAWAGSPVAVYNGSVLSLNGMNLTVSGCSLTLASVNVGCSATDGIFLQGLNTGRGTVTYEVIGASGGPVFSFATRQNGAPTLLDQLTFTLTATTNQPGSKISGAKLTINDVVPNSTTNYVSAAQTFSATSGYAAPTGLTSFSLKPISGATTASAGNTNFTNSPLLSTFQVTTTLKAQNSSYLGVQLNSMVQTFKTVPEPASIGLLAVAFAGIGFARRRRAI